MAEFPESDTAELQDVLDEALTSSAGVSAPPAELSAAPTCPPPASLPEVQLQAANTREQFRSRKRVYPVGSAGAGRNSCAPVTSKRTASSGPRSQESINAARRRDTPCAHARSPQRPIAFNLFNRERRLELKAQNSD